MKTWEWIVASLFVTVAGYLYLKPSTAKAQLADPTTGTITSDSIAIANGLALANGGFKMVGLAASGATLAPGSVQLIPAGGPILASTIPGVQDVIKYQSVSAAILGSEGGNNVFNIGQDLGLSGPTTLSDAQMAPGGFPLLNPDASFVWPLPQQVVPVGPPAGPIGGYAVIEFQCPLAMQNQWNTTLMTNPQSLPSLYSQMCSAILAAYPIELGTDPSDPFSDPNSGPRNLQLQYAWQECAVNLISNAQASADSGSNSTLQGVDSAGGTAIITLLQNA